MSGTRLRAVRQDVTLDREEDAMTVSRARIAAECLLQAEHLRTSEIADRLREHGVFPPALGPGPERDRQLKKTAETLRHLESLGLIERNTPAPGYCRAVDRDGLRRVVKVGVARYAREQRTGRQGLTADATVPA